jgi:DNA-binding phage protein
MPEFYVLLGDVVRSREVDDRAAFRRRLERACERASRHDEVHAPFDVLKGIDEIGGVLSAGTSIWSVVRSLTDELHPQQVRLALVSDEIDVGVETGDVSKMDGPAFHRASELLETVERSNLLFDMQTGRRPLDAAVADELNLLLLLRHEWTERQREVVASYRRHGTQSEVAEDLDVSQQAVSKSLRSASWPTIRTIEERLNETLRSYE